MQTICLRTLSGPVLQRLISPPAHGGRQHRLLPQVAAGAADAPACRWPTGAMLSTASGGATISISRPWASGFRVGDEPVKLSDDFVGVALDPGERLGQEASVDRPMSCHQALDVPRRKRDQSGRWKARPRLTDWSSVMVPFLACRVTTAIWRGWRNRPRRHASAGHPHGHAGRTCYHQGVSVGRWGTMLDCAVAARVGAASFRGDGRQAT